MRMRDAKKLRRDDLIKVKETGDIEMVMCVQDNIEEVIVYTREGSDYPNKMIEPAR
jgi:hypothetical protein